MGHNYKDTALLVFSLSSEKESRRKTVFGPSRPSENKVLFDILIQQTRELADKSGIDVFWVDESQQRGSDFASRFSNAFQDLFDKGYKKIVSVGNDSPELTPDILQDAIRRLQSKKLVLGPAKDGGVYLLGIQKSAFDKNNFQNLPWETSALHHKLVQFAIKQNFQFSTLCELVDLDNFNDVRLYSISNFNILSRYIQSLIRTERPRFTSAHFNYKSFAHLLSYGLRAPPFLR